MATIWGEDFSRILNTLHNLESVWSQAKHEGTDTAPIEQTIRELVAQMTDEQLDAFGEYEKERLAQEETKIKDLSQTLAELEAESARRKSRIRPSLPIKSNSVMFGASHLCKLVSRAVRIGG
jgi:hypothetical protein